MTLISPCVGGWQEDHAQGFHGPMHMQVCMGVARKPGKTGTVACTPCQTPGNPVHRVVLVTLSALLYSIHVHCM